MTVFDRFASEYHDYHGISPARAREQIAVLADLASFAGKPIIEVTDEHVRGYLSKLTADGQHANTIRKKRAMILPFFGWAYDVRLVDSEQFMRITRIKNPRGSGGANLPRPYDRREIVSLWAGLDESWPVREAYVERWRKGRSRWIRAWTTFMHYQVNAVTHLALHAGLRRDEIYYAPLNDIHYDNAYVVVRHAARKNGQGISEPREVPMTSGLASALEAWIERRTLLAPGHDFPWLSLTPFGPRNGQQYLVPMPHERFSSLLGTVGDGYELHRLRHTCATEWLRSGMALEQVQRLLGHARLQQTLGYAEIVNTDLEKSMARVASGFQTAVGRAA